MTKFGRYEIREELGRGGMATVYRAFDPATEREVALKVLPRQFTHDPTFVARFQREAKTIARLEHSHIVPIYDVGEQDDQPYIVMRLFGGGTLLDRIRHEGSLDLARALPILGQIADALDDAHAQGIVHRDLKPSNILFDQHGAAFVSDFGIAKVLASTASFTGTGIIGTPEYMSPEQAQAMKDLDARSDIYSLGAVVFQMLTGQLPYKADTPMAVALAHITQPVPSLRAVHPSFSEAVDAVLTRALAKDPAGRYARATEFVAALRTASEGKPMPVGLPTLMEPAPAALPSRPIGTTAPGRGAQPVAEPVHRPRTGLMWAALAGLGAAVVCIVVAVAVVLPQIGSAPNPTTAATRTPVPTKPGATNTPIPASAVAAPTLPISGPINKLCLVTGGSVTDKGFNEKAWKGLQAAAAQYGAQMTYLEPGQDDNYQEKNINTFLQSDCDLIVAVGFPFGDAVKAAAPSNPDQKFLILDFNYDLTMPNVWAQQYAADEASFLAGYAAASVSKTGKVGIFGGANIPPVTDFMSGFALGIDYYNDRNGTKVELIGWDVRSQTGLFTKDFTSTDLGRTAGNGLLDQGADVLFPVAAVTGQGAADAVLARKNAYLIGVDNDWVVELPQYASITLTSVEKRLDLSVLSAVRAIAEGNYEGGNYVGTLENGEIGISAFHSLDGLISDKVKADLEQIKIDIVAGKIKTKP